MNMNESFELVELARKLANLVRPGRVQAVRYDPPAVRVEIGDLVTAWLPPLVARAGNNRSWDMPEVGEQVVVLSPSGNFAQGWVLPAGYTASNPAPSVDPDKKIYTFPDGAWLEYDRKRHHLKAVLPDGATTELKSTGGIEFTGDLRVNGNITATQNITATGDITDQTRSMQADRAIYNSHKHSGVASGPSTTQTTGQQQ
ncbi:phage baseplate assembly protein V [Endozoicomonas gorgoniicola]|uniref:Phage baseplate assembly protein V n=1 Tax=Endozoicomonas gorgoniicola TaxID=1234144 RepID=A0ABT3MT84_9GAMM|nr:phage baseplate assembly protein V [Endozoicomonas gorgoniicola]MCW7552594.1 phage baseplate assembly protein V [Endozoicomonas gorgoniicola]